MDIISIFKVDITTLHSRSFFNYLLLNAFNLFFKALVKNIKTVSPGSINGIWDMNYSKSFLNLSTVTLFYILFPSFLR